MNTIVTRPYSVHEIEEWAASHQERMRKLFADGTHGGPKDIVLYTSPGSRYVKIMKSLYSGTQRSVWCFVEISTGNIYKAAGLNAPAKGVRGHISEDRYWDWAGGDFYR